MGIFTLKKVELVKMAAVLAVGYVAATVVVEVAALAEGGQIIRVAILRRAV
jgi:hypothetical protein